MLHAVAILVFAVIATYYISYETHKNVSMKRGYGWLLAAVIWPLVAAIASNILGGTLGNLVLHSVGGGVASTFLFIYLFQLFDMRLEPRIAFTALFAFVSSLGVLNEFYEFFMEATFGIMMSLDSQDTWRDFVANTAGAILSWLMISVLGKNPAVKTKESRS